MENITKVSEALENLLFEVVAFGDGYQLTQKDIEALCKIQECFVDIGILMENINYTIDKVARLEDLIDQLQEKVDKISTEGYFEPFEVSEIRRYFRNGFMYDAGDVSNILLERKEI